MHSVCSVLKSFVVPLVVFGGMAPVWGQVQVPTLPELALESYRLPNGLKVALHRDPTVPRVTVAVAYHVGSKNERVGRTGFAHFFEHMMFRGTKNVPNYDVPLQEAGAQSNAFTSEDMTVYFETVPAPWLERALYLEAERLAFLPSALDQDKFDTEREVVKNERRQRVDNVPYGLAEEVLLSHVFPPGHPYSWSVIGSMADLDKATLDDLKRFFAEFYHPGNATLCLVGDFDPAQAKEWIARYFGPLQAGPPPRRMTSDPVAPKAQRLNRVDRVQLPRIYWAWPTVADDHPDAPALDLLARVLSGSEASRLRRVVVLEQRLATEVDCTSDTKEISGLFTIDATAVEGKSLAEIERVLAVELERVRREPPSQAELDRALANLEREFYNSLTPPLGRAIVLATGFAQQDDPAYYRRDFARYFTVKPADLSRVARTYLTPEPLALAIEPAGEKSPENPPVSAGPRPSSVGEAPTASLPPSGSLDWSRMPGPGRPGAFQPPPIVRRILSNGLEVWIARWDLVPVVQAQLVLNHGSADDPVGKSGQASLTASLLDQGTTRLSAVGFNEALDLLGASINAGSNLDATTVSLSGLTRTLPATLKLLGEMLTQPRFDIGDFERERDLQLADLLQGPDRVDWIAQRAFRALIYGAGHPYGQPDDGLVETVRGLTLDDVRATARRMLAPRGSTLIVVGAVDPNELIARLEENLLAWKGEAPPRTPRPESTVKPKPGTVYLVDKPGAVQSVLRIGRIWQGRDDPRYFATLLGNRILGGDFLSRLNQNLRERNGFTYGAGSLFSYRRTGSVWIVNTSVRSDATAPALLEVFRELDGLVADRPFLDEEIAAARYSELQEFPERFESPGSILGVLREMVDYRLPDDYLKTYLKKLEDVEPSEVRRSMREVARLSERVVLIVGDRQSAESKLRALPGVTTIVLTSPDGVPLGP